jgi:hypothetical protein
MAKRFAIAVAVAGSVAGTASAQSTFKGTFTLPYETEWAGVILPAGAYTISFDSLSGPALLASATGRRTLVMPVSISDAAEDRPTALLLTRGEHRRVVRSFNWPEKSATLIYKPLTKAEQAVMADSGRTETLAVARLTR